MVHMIIGNFREGKEDEVPIWMEKAITMRQSFLANQNHFPGIDIAGFGEDCSVILKRARIGVHTF